MIISENPINRDILSETTIEFAFCPNENEIKYVFNENSFGGGINSNQFAFGKKYIDRYMSFEYKPRRATGEEQIKLSNIAGTSKAEFDINTRIEKFTELARYFIFNHIRTLNVIKLSADRNLLPELQNGDRTISEDGSGATNLLRQYLNIANLPNEIIEHDILEALKC